jgi:hypothetical protein
MVGRRYCYKYKAIEKNDAPLFTSSPQMDGFFILQSTGTTIRSIAGTEV